MRKNELNSHLREYSKSSLSPNQSEQKLVSDLYLAFKNALGQKTLMIGSYARYTAIRPLHDLDILFIAGKYDPTHLDPKLIMDDVHKLIDKHFINPTQYPTKISQQTHSITVKFFEGEKEIFSVDVVPAFTSTEKNNYGEEIYFVPEILRYGPNKRIDAYETLSKSIKAEKEWWILTDPRGYITAATELNNKNSDFRKAAKIVKRWKHNCKKNLANFKLKSFHIEQCLYEIFSDHPMIEVADAIFELFYSLPKIITKPQIKDRADSSKFIDEYIGSLTDAEKAVIIQARDGFLIKLENIASKSDINDLFTASIRLRKSDSETYLFDKHIPTYTDSDLSFKIIGKVLANQGKFTESYLDDVGRIAVSKHIKFDISIDNTSAEDYKWKVKNDDNSPQPRGEITDNKTANDPEFTSYEGRHYVECYAIKNGVCIAKSRQNVVLDKI